MEHFSNTSETAYERNPFEYKKLARLEMLFNQRLSEADRERLSETTVIACQHILETHMVMYEHMNRVGVPLDQLHVSGKIYSTSYEVLREMQCKGINAQQSPFDASQTFDQQHPANCARHIAKHADALLSGERVVILDDGGELIIQTIEFLKALSDEERARVNIAAVEQTSSGFRKLEKQVLPFPVINVARSNIKLEREAPLVANMCFEYMREYLEKERVQDPRTLVVGLGPIGAPMLEYMKQLGYAVGYDKQTGERDVANLILEENITVVIGCTGANIMSKEQMDTIEAQAKQTVHFASASSSDREFPVAAFRDPAGTDEIHDDVRNGKAVVLNNGFPITFKGEKLAGSPKMIEETMGLLMGSTIHAALSDGLKPGFHDVPEYVKEPLLKEDSN